MRHTIVHLLLTSSHKQVQSCIRSGSIWSTPRAPAPHATLTMWLWQPLSSRHWSPAPFTPLTDKASTYASSTLGQAGL